MSDSLLLHHTRFTRSFRRLLVVPPIDIIPEAAAKPNKNSRVCNQLCVLLLTKVQIEKLCFTDDSPERNKTFYALYQKDALVPASVNIRNTLAFSKIAIIAAVHFKISITTCYWRPCPITNRLDMDFWGILPQNTHRIHTTKPTHALKFKKPQILCVWTDSSRPKSLMCVIISCQHLSYIFFCST